MTVDREVPAAADTAGLLLGVVLDAVAGDPRRGHPVAGFGRAAAALERRLYADSKARGAVYTGICVTAAAGLGFAVNRLTRGRTERGRSGRARASAGWPRPEPVGGPVGRTAGGPVGRTAGGSVGRAVAGPVGRAVGSAVVTWVVLGGTSLGREGLLMARALEAGDIEAARRRLPHLCARDPRHLDGTALARATVESIAENTSDAVVAPLLWGAVAGVPGMLAYRAINTLDAMVGYRSPRYANFGWAAARLDDVANWIPARVTGLLTVACAPWAGGGGGRRAVMRDSYAILRRDGRAHPSPNAGRCEAAFAGALGVRLGGTNVYAGRSEDRPELGDGRPPEVPDIRRAVRLSTAVTFAAGLLAALISRVFARTRRKLLHDHGGGLHDHGDGRPWR